MSTIAAKSSYALTKYKRLPGTVSIIVCGHVNHEGITGFFRELLHEDHGAVSLHAVVLHPERPSQHMKALLDSPRYAGSITYLEGSPMNSKDLFRAGANSAAALFVLTNTSSESHEMEDAAAMLNTMAMKRHVFQRTGLDIAAYVQLILPESKRHFAATHSNHMSLSLICTEELKLNLLALSCTCPGASTLIHNLVASERIGTENVWEELPDGSTVMLDGDFHLHRLDPPEGWTEPELPERYRLPST